MQICLRKEYKMKIFSILYAFGVFLFLLPATGNATHNTHMPIVLIVKEDLERKKDYEKIIKHEAYDSVMQIFESKHDDMRFVDKVIQFYDKNDTNRTRTNLNQFIQENKQNIVYIVFLPKNTSKYNKIKNYLPERIPIIAGIGTAKSLDKNNTWVTTTSSLAKGKAIAIKKLMHMENKNELIVLYDKANDIDTYTKEVLSNLEDMNISVSKIGYTKGEKIESPKKLQKKNKLILLVSKSSDKTIDIFKNYIDTNKNQENDILLLKIKNEERKDINLTKSKIFELTYNIPGYNPDFRLPLYQEIEGTCDNLEGIDKHICLKMYGNEYIRLHTYLNLALGPQDENPNKTKISESNINVIKNNEKNIIEMRKHIHNNIINHNKTNTYYHEKTNALAMFRKSGNFYYSALIESNITNYYIVRLDNKNDGFLHYNQISNSDKKGNRSLSTVYLDMKLSNLIVENLSASSAYIEGYIRILTTNEKFDLDEMYRMNSLDSVLKKSEIIFVKENPKEIDDMTMYEKFYTFKGNFNINNNLFRFPFDQQKIYISFTPRDTNGTSDSYLMHLQEQDKKRIDFDKWYVERIKPFLSKEIMMFKDSAIEQNSSVSYKPVSNFEITIHRKTATGFIMKFIIPILIILLLALGTQIHLHRRRDLGIAISIYISSFAGIISIYFIFNLVIGIESLIGFDFVFLIFLGFPVGLMIYNIYKHRNKISKK